MYVLLDRCGCCTISDCGCSYGLSVNRRRCAISAHSSRSTFRANFPGCMDVACANCCCTICSSLVVATGSVLFVGVARLVSVVIAVSSVLIVVASRLALVFVVARLVFVFVATDYNNNRDTRTSDSSR